MAGSSRAPGARPFRLARARVLLVGWGGMQLIRADRCPRNALLRSRELVGGTATHQAIPGRCLDGVSGVDDPQLATLPQDSLDLLELMKETAELDDATVGRFTRWVADAIEGRNVAGLCDPTKSNLFAADTQDIVRSAALLGMSRDAVVQALPKLRGSARR